MDACSRRGARRAAAAPGGGARAVAGGARRRGAGRPRPGGAAAGDGGGRAHGGRAAPGGGAAALRRWTLLGPDADPAARARVHYTLAQAMVRVEDDAGAHRESAAAMALVPAEPPSEVRTWAAATHARMSYAVGLHGRGRRRGRGGARGGRRARAWTARGPTPPSPRCGRGPDVDPAAVQRRLDEALRAGPPVRRRRRRDAGAVQPGHRRVRGRPDRRGARLDAAGDPAGARPRHRVVVLPGRAPAPAGHRAVHGRRLGREPGRGRPAGPGAGDGRARARRRPAGAGRPRRPGRPGAAGLGAGADPAAARARAAGHGHGRLGDRPRRLGRRPGDGRRGRAGGLAGGCSGSGRTTTSACCGWSGTALAPVADAAAAARLVGDAASAGRWGARARSWSDSRGRPSTSTPALRRDGRRGEAWLARVEAEAARLRGEAAAGAVAGRGRGVRLRARVRGGPVAVAAGRGAAGDR